MRHILYVAARDGYEKCLEAVGILQTWPRVIVTLNFLEFQSGDLPNSGLFFLSLRPWAGTNCADDPTPYLVFRRLR